MDDKCCKNCVESYIDINSNDRICTLDGCVKVMPESYCNNFVKPHKNSKIAAKLAKIVFDLGVFKCHFEHKDGTWFLHEDEGAVAALEKDIELAKEVIKFILET